jgi:two-component system sensor histidine kinase QseC
MTSISRFLVFRLMVLFVLIWASLSVFLHFGMRNQLKRQLDYRLTTQTEAIASLVEVNPDGSLTMDFIEEFMPEFSLAGDQYFQIWEPNGRTFLRSGSLRGNELPRAPAEHISRSWQDARSPEGEPGRIHWYYFIPRFEHEELNAQSGPVSPLVETGYVDERQKVLIAVLILKEDILLFLSIFRILLVIFGIVGAALLAVLVTRVVRHGLQPLGDLTHAARFIRVGDKDARFPEPKVEELQDIALRLNELLDRQRSAFENEQRFSSNVAHDLRTPIAELRTVTEVALRKADNMSDLCRESLEDCHGISVEMGKLVDSLLEMLRCQHEAVSGGAVKNSSFNPYDEILACFDNVPKRKGQLRWTFNCEQNLLVEANRDAIANVIRQLLSNATEHAPLHSEVIVSLKKDHSRGTFFFRTQNEAPYLSDDTIDRLFVPFWRGDSHRGSRQNNGLGLVIAKASAEAAGGQLQATLEDGQIVFTFRF